LDSLKRELSDVSDMPHGQVTGRIPAGVRPAHTFRGWAMAFLKRYPGHQDHGDRRQRLEDPPIG
jgi:hypothetical protein